MMFRIEISNSMTAESPRADAQVAPATQRVLMRFYVKGFLDGTAFADTLLSIEAGGRPLSLATTDEGGASETRRHSDLNPALL